MKNAALTRAKVFRSGNSQAVRLPRGVRFPEGVREVLVRREGERVILQPVAAERFDPEFWDVLGSAPGFRRPPRKRQRRRLAFA
jgi:antitoxin VapB